VLLRDISPPETLKRAIEAKQQAEQEALAMTFRLQKERQEAERKRIEAQGIKDFQDIVRQGIDEKLLVWKGIEATETLAKSPNTEIIVVGNKQGLPLILGSERRGRASVVKRVSWSRYFLDLNFPRLMFSVACKPFGYQVLVGETGRQHLQNNLILNFTRLLLEPHQQCRPKVPFRVRGV